MIVDNYSDTEIFLKFLHQILEIDILEVDPPLQLYGLKSVMGVTVSFPVVETAVFSGSNTTDFVWLYLSVTFTLPCMRAVENSFSL